MTSVGRTHLVAVAAGLWSVTTATVRAEDPPARISWEWTTAPSGSQEMNSGALESAWGVLKDRHVTALLVIRHDRIVFERYALGQGRTKPHYTASLAKALVGGVGADGGDARRSHQSRRRGPPVRAAVAWRSEAASDRRPAPGDPYVRDRGRRGGRPPPRPLDRLEG